jgi:phosphate transport system permease protein
MSAKLPSELPIVSDRLAKNAMRNLTERLIEFMLLAAAAVSVLTTLGIVYVLVSESIVFFSQVGIVDFLTDTQWTPLFDDAHFGIMVLISGTLVSSFVALAVAIPMGTDHRHLPFRIRRLKSARNRQADS